MKKEEMSRRVLLRGALAVGCGLWVPIVLSAAAPAAKKVPKANVQYQTRPKGEQKCGLCVHFIAESNTCKLVDGQISPESWCSLWTKKA
jgi:hypothetical protein